MRIPERDPSLQTTMDWSMESIFLSNSGVHQRAESIAKPKWGSRSNAEWREASLQAWSHGLHTSIAPRHRCSRVSRERTLVRHSWVKSAQSVPGPESDSSSPSLVSIFEGWWFESGLVKVVICFHALLGKLVILMCGHWTELQLLY